MHIIIVNLMYLSGVLGFVMAVGYLLGPFGTMIDAAEVHAHLPRERVVSDAKKMGVASILLFGVCSICSLLIRTIA